MTKDKDAIIAALQAEINTMKTIISMMPGHVYWKNANGQYMGCNQNLANVLKLSSPEDIIGKTDADLMGCDLGNETTKIDLAVLNSNQENRVEEVGFDADGLPAIYLTQKSPLYGNSGEIEGVLGISLDITARKQMEDNLKIAKHKAEAANRAKSQFLAMISHELRTPLTSILGFVSFLEQDNLAEQEKKRFIQFIVSSGSYLFSLINNLLDYNKLETNKYELFQLPVDLKKLMQDIISMLSVSAKLKNLNLSMDYSDDIPSHFITDERVIRQILINLIGNAIKYTDKGHVILRVNCIRKNSDDCELLIAVEDTGIGIPENQQKSVFKRFHQVEHVYTRNTSLTGTGLGLAIVRKLVKLLGSKIEVVSSPNQGSTFSFIANLKLAKINKIENHEKLHVLLVEDDTLIQIVHKQMLEELNCEVAIADCASATLKMLHQGYDIIFADIGLPDMSGFDLISQIRKEFFSKESLPIIALTGYSEIEERQRCLTAGADEVVIKPISTEIFRHLLERYGRKYAIQS
jgi:two-component system aerobic respiration control sensor histidine kinase ArcB